METGIIDIEHQAKKKQIMMKHRIKHTASNLSLMETTMNAGIRGWKSRTEALGKAIDLSEGAYDKSKQSFKTEINRSVNKKYKEKIEKDSENKSKVQHLKEGQQEWEPGKMKPYILKCTRKVASTIFQAKCRMCETRGR